MQPDQARNAKARHSPINRLGTILQRASHNRNLTPTLDYCVATWPVDPDMLSLDPLESIRAAMWNLPDAIWHCARATKPRFPRAHQVHVWNPNPTAIASFYINGWLPLMARGREAWFAQDDANDWQIPASWFDPANMPMTLVATLDVPWPPWQDTPVWLSHRLR